MLNTSPILETVDHVILLAMHSLQDLHTYIQHVVCTTASLSEDKLISL